MPEPGTGPEEALDPASWPGAVIGLDLGQVRIGVAISDPARRVAIPLGTVRAGSPSDMETIGSLAREHRVTLIVVGLPLRLSGERGDAAARAEAFADALHGALGVPVVLQDERLSTVQADRSLAAAGATGRKRRRTVDRSAAAVILQAYLDGVNRPR